MINVDKNFYRGPRPSYSFITENKFEVIVDLQSGTYEFWHDDDLERAEGDKSNGITWINYDLSNLVPPSKKTTSEIIDRINCLINHKVTMQTYDEYGNTCFKHDTDKAKVYLHCLRGKDRTGFVCAAYRMKYMGWTFKQAVHEMLGLGFNKWIYFWWIPFLKKYEK